VLSQVRGFLTDDAHVPHRRKKDQELPYTSYLSKKAKPAGKIVSMGCGGTISYQKKYVKIEIEQNNRKNASFCFETGEMRNGVHVSQVRC
jgi:hypothetical protein